MQEQKKSSYRKFNLVSLHYGTRCTRNPRCKWCYGKSHKEHNKSIKFYCDMIPYLKKITHQVAIGSHGEPLLYPRFLYEFTKKARVIGLITNLTTNGDLIEKIGSHILKGFTLVSVSFNAELIRDHRNLEEYLAKIRYLKKLGIKTGCNLLIDESMFVKDRRNIPFFVSITKMLFRKGIGRVFALYPKCTEAPDILKHKLWYHALGSLYNHFYVDDVTHSVLTNGSYTNWKEPCHFGKQSVNINGDGSVTGCSFSNRTYMTIDKPSDILKIPELKFEENFECPYIKKE